MKSVEDIIKKRRMTAAQLLQHPLIQSRKQRGKGLREAKAKFKYKLYFLINLFLNQLY